MSPSTPGIATTRSASATAAEVTGQPVTADGGLDGHGGSDAMTGSISGFTSDRSFGHWLLRLSFLYCYHYWLQSFMVWLFTLDPSYSAKLYELIPRPGVTQAFKSCYTFILIYLEFSALFAQECIIIGFSNSHQRVLSRRADMCAWLFGFEGQACLEGNFAQGETATCMRGKHGEHGLLLCEGYQGGRDMDDRDCNFYMMLHLEYQHTPPSTASMLLVEGLPLPLGPLVYMTSGCLSPPTLPQPVDLHTHSLLELVWTLEGNTLQNAES